MFTKFVNYEIYPGFRFNERREGEFCSGKGETDFFGRRFQATAVLLWVESKKYLNIIHVKCRSLRGTNDIRGH